MNKIGVVILNFNTFDDTKECVESVFLNTRNLFKIYIVDNASSDDSLKQIVDLYSYNKKITIIKNNENKGFSGGNNSGIKVALKDGCDYIYLLNSDIVLKNDAIDVMSDFLEKNEKVAIVGPSVYNIKNEYAQSAKLGINTKAYFYDKKIIRNIFKKQAFKNRFLSYEKENDFVFKGMVSGCCFGVRNTFFKEFGLLDDNVFLYYEEDILAYKLDACDYYCGIVSKAKVLHKEGISTKKISNDKMTFTRYYRWSSSYYVLCSYSNGKKTTLRFIGFLLKTLWRTLSIVHKSYRIRKKSFISKISTYFKGIK